MLEPHSPLLFSLPPLPPLTLIPTVLLSFTSPSLVHFIRYLITNSLSLSLLRILPCLALFIKIRK
jgi:hypothetical protein